MDSGGGGEVKSRTGCAYPLQFLRTNTSASSE